MTQQPFAGDTPPASHPGKMTAVMRATPRVQGPKVLRIGLVQGGRVLEERVMKQRAHVTVGPSEKNTFVVSAAKLPVGFKLFELVGTDYHLNFLDGMTGRVSLEGGPVELAALRSTAQRTSQGAYRVRLTEKSRGKVVVGDVTFLFQFVAPPPMQPKPQLPVTVKGGLASQIDWKVTIIAAFSFLFHFGMVGALYSDWMDPVVNEELGVAGLIQAVKSLPPPPPVEVPQVETPKEAPTAAATVEAPTKAPVRSNQAKGGSGERRGSMSASERAALTSELEQLQMETLGAFGSTGPATAGVLKSGEVPTGILDQIAASGAGVTASGPGDLKLGSGGGAPLRPGQTRGSDLGSVGSTKAGTKGGSGPAATVKGPTGTANVGSAAISGGSVSNADRVVAGMRAGFRACYNRGLANNPDLHGSVKIVARVGPNGDVVSATPQGGSTLGQDVINCVVRRVKAAQFDPPSGGGATVVIPVTFALQR